MAPPVAKDGVRLGSNGFGKYVVDIIKLYQLTVWGSR
jgi:hypothetical protein